MSVAIFGVLALVLAIAGYVAGVAAGKLAASRERGEDPNKVNVSVQDLLGGTKHHAAKAS